MNMLAGVAPVTKVSSYRQSGYREVATGQIHEFFGSDQPPQDGSFVVVWDNQVEMTVTVSPFIPPPPSPIVA